MEFEISQKTKELLDSLNKIFSKETPEEVLNPIVVSRLTNGLEFFYEKVRNTLDYREENLWFKNAVLRFLKRKLLDLFAGEEIGLELIQELIRGRYLENRVYSKNKAKTIDNALQKYVKALEILEEKSSLDNKEIQEIENWFLGIASLEITEIFINNDLDRSLINYFYETLKDKIEIPENLDLNVFYQQLYLSIYRNFLQADAEMENFELFKLNYSEWFSNSIIDFENFALNLSKIKNQFKLIIDNPLKKNLDNLIRRKIIILNLLKELIINNRENIEEILTNPETLEEKLKTLYEQKYIKAKNKLKTSAIRSLIFIIVIKILVLFIIEIPYQNFISGEINYLPIAINLFMPPLVLLITTIYAKFPSEEQNFLKILIDFEKMIRPNSSNIAVLKISQKRTLPAQIAIGIMYTLDVLMISFLFYQLLVGILNYNIIDIAVFILFLSIVSFFAFRLRNASIASLAIEEKENAISILVEFIFFPIIEIGKFLSESFSSINVPAFIFDFFIETPFKTVIEILEEWFSFLREKKQNL